MSWIALLLLSVLAALAVAGLVANLRRLAWLRRRAVPPLRSSDWDWDRFEAEFRAHVQRRERGRRRQYDGGLP